MDIPQFHATAISTGAINGIRMTNSIGDRTINDEHRPSVICRIPLSAYLLVRGSEKQWCFDEVLLAGT